MGQRSFQVGQENKIIKRIDEFANQLRQESEQSAIEHEGALLSQLLLTDKVLKVCQANSLWPMTFGLACCAIEMMATGMARIDIARYGAEVFRPSARQCDLLIVSGTVNKKMAPAVITLYEQMPSPKWVIAMGNCAISGGPFAVEENYNVIEGVDKLIPVDVYIPGCPPRPEALIEGILTLQKKITGGRYPWPQRKMPEKPEVIKI
jgi:NADH-quinone oxidoreductase subunit B